MVKLLLICLLLTAGSALAQTREVNPDDLKLTVTIEDFTGSAPFAQEMVLLTIHGVYQRHITLEKLIQPAMPGVNWMQLGHDHWYESRVGGKTVKNMRRRIAIFPETSGRLEIGEFRHVLTLLDEDNKWFEHEIRSDPVALDVVEPPDVDDWWFPVRGLEVSDRWSNPPDQLGEGEGVLRIITLKAIGAAPDMLPPMPELRSPSAHIFAHPEKRLVELSPEGPVALAFWRWTIKPRNPPSAILEPIEFSYFDTTERQLKRVRISAQRVALSGEDLPPPASKLTSEAAPTPRLSPMAMLGIAALSLLVGFGAMLGRQNGLSRDAFRARVDRWVLRRALGRAARREDLPEMRRIVEKLDRISDWSENRTKMRELLDEAIFSRSGEAIDLKALLSLKQ